MSGAAWPASLPPPAGRGGTLHLDALPAPTRRPTPARPSSRRRCCALRAAVCAARASHRRLLNIGPRFRHVHRRGGRRRGARGARRRRAARVRRAGGRRHDEVFVGDLPDDASDDDLWDVLATAATSRRGRSSAVSVATRGASAASPPTVPPPLRLAGTPLRGSRLRVEPSQRGRRRRRRRRPRHRRRRRPGRCRRRWSARPLGGGRARATTRRPRVARRARGGGRAPRGREPQGPAARRRGRPFLIRGAARRAERRRRRRARRGRRVGRRRAALAQEWGRVVGHALHLCDLGAGCKACLSSEF